MKYGTKEFNESLEMFDKIAVGYGLNIKRDSKEEITKHIKNGMLIIYQNGETNKMFKMFLHGVECGKFIFN